MREDLPNISHTSTIQTIEIFRMNLVLNKFKIVDWLISMVKSQPKS